MLLVLVHFSMAETNLYLPSSGKTSASAIFNSFLQMLLAHPGNKKALEAALLLHTADGRAQAPGWDNLPAQLRTFRTEYGPAARRLRDVWCPRAQGAAVKHVPESAAVTKPKDSGAVPVLSVWKSAAHHSPSASAPSLPSAGSAGQRSFWGSHGKAGVHVQMCRAAGTVCGAELPGWVCVVLRGKQ